MASVQKLFFNLPQQTDLGTNEKSLFASASKHSLDTNWKTFRDQAIEKSSLVDLFANRIPVVRVPGVLNASECEQMLRIVETHELVSSRHLRYELRDPQLTSFRGTMILKILGRGWARLESRNMITSAVCCHPFLRPLPRFPKPEKAPLSC
jgi:hypothetical protein